MIGQRVPAARARPASFVRRALVAAALGALAGAGCYDVPRPDCGFRCGPAGECPEDYTCSAADGRCHRDGTPVSLVCGTVDAAIDAAPDAAPDAPVDAPPDAPPDAM